MKISNPLTPGEAAVVFEGPTTEQVAVAIETTFHHEMGRPPPAGWGLGLCHAFGAVYLLAPRPRVVLELSMAQWTRECRRALGPQWVG